jgi:CheY-like chemotaxis protein
MSTKRYRAVILDDNSMIRKVLWSFLDRLGYEVFTFPDPGLCPLHVLGKCACPASTTCADVIVSDLNMVDGNGIDFLEQLVQKGCQRPQFALMSGDFSDEDLSRASRLGCALFKKPLDLAQFAKWLEEVERSIPSKRTLYNWYQNCLPDRDVSARP